MKKFIALALGLSLLAGGAIVVGANASYYRPTTSRLSPYKYRNMLRTKYQHRTYRATPFGYSVRDWQYNSRMFNQSTQFNQKWNSYNQRTTQTFDRKAYATYRAQRPNLFPRNANLYQSHTNVVHQNDYLTRAYTSRATTSLYRTEGNVYVSPNNLYTVRLVPEYVRLNEGQYLHQPTELQVNVSHTPAPCNALSFEYCAIQNGKHLRDARDLGSARYIARYMNTKKMNVNGAIVEYPVMAETYEVNEYGQRKFYYLFNVFNPKDATITTIEGLAPAANRIPARNAMNSLATSFQFVL